MQGGRYGDIPVRDAVRFHEHVESLMPSQLEIVRLLDAWFRSRRVLVVMVSGGPGSGKTHSVVRTLDLVSANVVRMAYTARVAENIGGRTVHSSMRLAWGPGSVLRGLNERLGTRVGDDDYVESCLREARAALLPELRCASPPPDVLVIDEIGMIPFYVTIAIVEKHVAENRRVLVFVMGDSDQLGPVQSLYNVFEVGFPGIETVFVALTENRRFVPEYRAVVDRLRGLMRDEGAFADCVRDVFPVVEDVDGTVLDRCERVLTYTRAKAENYNAYYVERSRGKVYCLYRYFDGRVNRTDAVYVKEGCLVNVTENNCGPATNGTTLRFVGYDSKRDAVDCEDPERGGVTVSIGRSRYTGRIPVVPGFAITIHKCQGETIDARGVLFDFDGCTDVRVMYTALSRVRTMDQILAVKF